MQQYNVPQFVEVEDKIIGPFTLKQFLVMLAGGVVILLYWLVFSFGVLFWILSVPTALATVFIALGSMNGRSVLSSVFPFLSFLFGAKTLFFKHEAPELIIKQDKTSEENKQEVKSEPNVESRLRRLAYIMDQKRQEEEGLVTQASEIDKSSNQDKNTNS